MNCIHDHIVAAAAAAAAATVAAAGATGGVAHVHTVEQDYVSSCLTQSQAVLGTLFKVQHIVFPLFSLSLLLLQCNVVHRRHCCNEVQIQRTTCQFLAGCTAGGIGQSYDYFARRLPRARVVGPNFFRKRKHAVDTLGAGHVRHVGALVECDTESTCCGILLWCTKQPSANGFHCCRFLAQLCVQSTPNHLAWLFRRVQRGFQRKELTGVRCAELKFGQWGLMRKCAVVDTHPRGVELFRRCDAVGLDGGEGDRYVEAEAVVYAGGGAVVVNEMYMVGCGSMDVGEEQQEEPHGTREV